MSQKFLILGDFIWDTYIFGSVEKISPEAPVMEFVLSGEIQHKFGGAANVAWILENLNIGGIFLCKAHDSEDDLRKQGLSFNLMQFHPIRHGKTCRKIRLIDTNYHQHILRIAQEDGILPHELFVREYERHDMTCIDKVIFSDYQKGFLSRENILYVREKNQDLPILVAIKHNWEGYNHIEGLPDCDVVVGNHKEIAHTFSVSPKEVLTSPVFFAERIVKERGHKNCVITLGAKGAAYFSLDGKGRIISTIEREIFDVTGAGDSFFSVVCYLWGNDDIETIIGKANAAAGMNVENLGNTLVDALGLNPLELKIED